MGAVVLGGVRGAVARDRLVPSGRLAAWATLVLVVGALNLGNRETSGPPARNVLYSYATAAGGVVQYLIILGVVLLIARGLDRREVFALRAPRSIGRAGGWVAAALVSIWVVSFALGHLLDAGKEQGLVPDRWQPDRAGAFAANFAVIALLAPVVEELTFRGLGVAGVSSAYGPSAAVIAVGVAFGIWHGLVIAFPILAILGAILAALRLRTDSVYPPMVVHAIFNAAALVVAVTLGRGA